jgi:L-alanine-DL-glutamate epimerase-like enolase superfamily enzyme
VHVLAAPSAQPIRMAHGTMTTRRTVLVEIEESSGVTGWGESWVNFPPWAWRERLATIEDGLKPLLVGADPTDRDALWATMYGAMIPMARQWGAIGPVMQAISGVDIALWDLAGRLADRGVAALLREAAALRGEGADTRLPAYASGIGPDAAVPKARRAIAAGFSAIKLKVGFDPTADRHNVAAVRGAVGPDVTVMIDVNQAWTVEQTLAEGAFLASQDIRWVEEPVPSADEHELRQIAGKLAVPVAAGENVYGTAGFTRLFDAGAVDIAQPDVCKTGGITEMARIASLAHRHGVPWAPHFYGAAVGAAATLHCFAGMPGGLIVEWDANPNVLRDELVVDGFDVRDGTVALPRGPGLGIDIDRRALERFRVTP